jgi:hypothetical protein
VAEVRTTPIGFRKLANIREAIVGCLEVRAEQGLPLTVRTVEIDVAVG